MSDRSKRLRKKLYLEEFAVLGSEVSFNLSAEEEAAYDNALGELVTFMESNSLIMSIAADGNQFCLYVSSHSRYQSLTEEDRVAIQGFLESKDAFTEINVSALSDAYYGS